MYGLGNWGDVCDHVGTKTESECKEHYFKNYIDCPTAPLPVWYIHSPFKNNVGTS